MADHARIRLGYTKTTATTMSPGVKAVFPRSAMVVGPDLRCWIDPFSEPLEKIERLSGTINSVVDTLSLERTSSGYRVDLSMIKTPFEVRGTPEPKLGIPWIPVMELVYPRDGSPIQ
jgi:hypothetical protein